MNNKVTVIVPTYNQEKYISQCIESILAQKTDFNFCILIGEDESTDNTRDICLEYQKKYPDKVQVVLQSRKNVIKINNRITGRYNFIDLIKRITTPYWAICEGDDYWTDNKKLQKQVDFLEQNPDYSVTFSKAQVVDEKNTPLPDTFTKQVPDTTTIDNLLTKGNYIHTPTVLYRNVLKSNLPDFMLHTSVGDYPLHILHAMYGKLYKFEDPMAAYRSHNAGVWSNANNAIKNYGWLQTLIYIYNYFHNNSRFQKLMQEQIKIAFRNIGISPEIFKNCFSKNKIDLNEINIMLARQLCEINNSTYLAQKTSTTTLINALFLKFQSKFLKCNIKNIKNTNALKTNDNN